MIEKARRGAEVVDALRDIEAEALEVQAEAEVRLLDLGQAQQAEAEGEPARHPVLAAEAHVGVAVEDLVDVGGERQALLEQAQGVPELDDDRQLVVRVAGAHRENVLHAEAEAIRRCPSSSLRRCRAS